MKESYEIKQKSFSENADDFSLSLDYPQIADEVTQVVQKRFPFGAFNRVDVANKFKILSPELLANLQTVMTYHSAMKQDKSDEDRANIIQPLVLGNCGLFVDYAIGYLKNKYPSLNAECLVFRNHCVVLMGRKPGSDRWDVKAWGAKAFICDIWAARNYLASELTKEKQGPGIKFFYTIKSGYFIPNKGHYLAGSMVVVKNMGDIHSYEKCGRWVRVDLLRREAPHLTIPSLSFCIPNELAPEEIIVALGKITKSTGWKLGSTTKKPLLVCKDVEQADRVMASLDISKTAVTRFIKEKLVVVCDFIDLVQLKSLAKSLDLDISRELAALNLNEPMLSPQPSP